MFYYSVSKPEHQGSHINIQSRFLQPEKNVFPGKYVRRQAQK